MCDCMAAPHFVSYVSVDTTLLLSLPPGAQARISLTTWAQASISLPWHTKGCHCLRRLSQEPRPQSLIYLYDARPQNWYPQNWYGAHMQRKLRDQAAGTLDSSTHTCTQGLFSHIKPKCEWIEGFFFRFVTVTNRGLEAVVRSRCSNCATIC